MIAKEARTLLSLRYRLKEELTWYSSDDGEPSVAPQSFESDTPRDQSWSYHFPFRSHAPAGPWPRRSVISPSSASRAHFERCTLAATGRDSSAS